MRQRIVERPGFRGAWLLLALAASGAALAGGLSCPAPFEDSGLATFYDASGGVNNCSLDIGDGLVAAINDPQWDGSSHCGECLRVTGPEGTVVVRVTDRCPECMAGDLDLSESAFAAIADPLQGVVPISWSRVECPVSGPVSYRFQGSNPFYFKIQVRNHRYGIQAMEYQSGAGFVPMDRTADNHFQATGVPNLDSAVVRITATSGEQLTDAIGSPSQTGDIPGDVQLAACDGVFLDGFEAVLP
jgi:expansin (peptidoglycan-binding protein)